MYHIEYAADDRWKVLDQSGQAIFVGTRRQIEDWLDFQENIVRHPSPRTSQRERVRALVSWLGHIAGRIGQRGELPSRRIAASSHVRKD